MRSYVNIAITNYYHPLVPIRGNGSLIKIHWTVNPTAGMGAATPLDFTIANIVDENGNYLEPCRGPIAPCINPADVPIPDPFDPAWSIGRLEVGANPVGLDFQVALEGGKLPSAAPAVVPNPARPAVNIEATQFGGSVPGTVLDDFGNANIPAIPPYDTVEITRPGYLGVSDSNVTVNAWPLITLLAGDVNGDDTINISDIAMVGAQLNARADVAYREKMDFNDDKIITIADLALVAKNYGINGPSPITRSP